jgi:hypothetical protein
LLGAKLASRNTKMSLGNRAARNGIAEQYRHRNDEIIRSDAIVHAEQCHFDRLRVCNSRESDEDPVSLNVCAARGSRSLRFPLIATATLFAIDFFGVDSAL